MHIWLAYIRIMDKAYDKMSCLQKVETEIIRSKFRTGDGWPTTSKTTLPGENFTLPERRKDQTKWQFAVARFASV